MVNEPTSQNQPSSAATDPELEKLLGGAYDAPPVPRSLVKRIDRAIAAEWGEPPNLGEKRPARGKKTLLRQSRWIKSLPIAASVTLIVVLSVVFSGNSRAYGWAALVEAMQEQGVIQIDADDETRWLSISEGVLSHRSSSSSRFLDIEEGVILERDASAMIVRRHFLPENTEPALSRNQLVLGFLLGEPFRSEDSSHRLAGVRVVDESWKEITAIGSEQIALKVTFETNAFERIELNVTLDPETELPSSFELLDSNGDAKSLALSYPLTTVDELKTHDFPADLSIVDVNTNGDPTLQVAPNGPPATNFKAAANDLTTVETLNRDPLNPKPSRPPMFGAASDWKAVLPVTLPGDEVVKQINVLMKELWRKNKISPAAPASNEELMRRVYLDLVGRTPSVNEVRSYAGDKSANRYETLVDRLLKSPDHASHLATVWRTFLIPEGVDLTAFGGVQAFDQWLAERFASDDSYDEITRSLLLAEGRLSRSGPLLFYSAVKLDPEQLASRTARVFLGMRLECAQCHDHPFEPWSQEDFWSFAAFFAQISRPRGTLENVSTLMRVRDVDHGEVTLPETDTVVMPKLLDGSGISKDTQSTARRQQMAHWLTGSENPYFARATANRVWGQLFGKGIVDPIDDFGVQHEPKSAELLDLLAGHFINSDFSLRELFRTVVLSRAYRLSSGAETNDEERLDWFAQMNTKALTAEQVYDCITVATLLNTASPSGLDTFNVNRVGNSPRDAFIQQFRTPSGRMTEYQGGIPQALTLMNGGLIEGATGLSSSGLLKSLEAPFFSNKQRIEILYIATLSRQPHASEWKLLKDYISDDASGTELQEGLADILWALLNSAEFTLNH